MAQETVPGCAESTVSKHETGVDTPFEAPSDLTRSLGEVYRAHHAFVWRVLRRSGIPEDQVWDAVQDVFLIVACKLHTFEGRAALRTWLFRIAVRVAYGLRRDRLRSERRFRSLEPHHGHNTKEPPADAAVLLHGLLDALDDKKRTVFIMAELEGMTAREIAETLEINVNTVYSRLRLAREHLSQVVARDESCHRRRAWIRG